MAGGITTLLDISKRSLGVQSQQMRLTGNNISNANTPGYVRRKAELVSSDADGIEGNAYGLGVDVNRVVRVVDEFLQRTELARTNDRADSGVRQELLSRAEAQFGVDSSTGRIGGQLSSFFSALQDLTVNPADIALRSNVINAGEQLTESIRNTYNALATLQREADDRVRLNVEDINRLTGQIAEMNSQIVSSEGSGQQNLTVRDKRDELLRALAEKVSFQRVDNSDGSVTLQLASGFGLVVGPENREIEYTASASFEPAGGYPAGLDGGGLGSVVFDFDTGSGTSHIDLTGVLASGGGEMAGLLKFRGVQSATDTSTFDAAGDVLEIAGRVEAIARDLLVRFNASYRGPSDEDTGDADFDASSGDLTNNRPAVFGLFTSGTITDGGTVGLPELGDLSAAERYAGALQFGVTDPSRLAAAVDQNTGAGAYTFSPGDGRNIEALIRLRTEVVDYSTYGIGNLTSRTTIEELYGESVGRVGAMVSSAEGRYSVTQASESQIKELISATSGVNIDEEFANLVNLQRAFQASSRLIKVGDELLQEIIGLAG